MKKNLILLFFLLGLCVFLLSGCGEKCQVVCEGKEEFSNERYLGCIEGRKSYGYDAKYSVLDKKKCVCEVVEGSKVRFEEAACCEDKDCGRGGKCVEFGCVKSEAELGKTEGAGEEVSSLPEPVKEEEKEEPAAEEEILEEEITEESFEPIGPSTCEGGVSFGKCKGSKYCEEGILVEKCSVCECGEGKVCWEEKCIEVGEEPEKVDLKVLKVLPGFERKIKEEGVVNFRGIKVKVCNLGKKETFDGLKIKIGKEDGYSLIWNDLELGFYECNSQVIDYWELGMEAGKSYKVKVTVDPENLFEELKEDNNLMEVTVKVPSCGNYACEEGESYESCGFDCEIKCRSGYCNSKVLVSCDCEEFNLFSKWHEGLGSCGSCEGQEELLGYYLKVQSEVYDCLSGYFGEEPSRVPYFILPDSSAEVCGEKKGCEDKKEGITRPGYILFRNLGGLQPQGEKHPTRPSHLRADKEEMSRYFLYQMLHEVPDWFREAVVMQTEERLVCQEQERKEGSVYLVEKEGEEGTIQMSGGGVLDTDFYKKWKEGEVSLSGSEEEDVKVKAALFVMALKEEYNCGKSCMAEIVKELKAVERASCSRGEGCGVEPLLGAERVHIDNALIKEKTEKVVKGELGELFDTLGIPLV